MNNIKTSKAENTKTNIIKALEQLSKDQNLDNIKIRDICTLANISVGTFYLYFKSKEEAILYIYQQCDEQFRNLKLTNDPLDNIYQILDIGGKKLPVAAGCELMDRTEKEFGMKIRLYYLEEVANKVIDLQFEGDKVKIRAVGTPNLVKFMEKLFGEAMMQRTKKLGRWKDSTFLKEKMKKVLFPESEGIAR